MGPRTVEEHEPPETGQPTTKSWVPPNMRVLNDNVVEIFKGDLAGTFEVHRIEQLGNPLPLPVERHRWQVGGKQPHRYVTAVDYAGITPFSLFGRGDGIVGICKPRYELDFPWTDIQHVWRTPNKSPVFFAKLNKLDNGLFVTGYADDADYDYLTVVDMARGQGMKKNAEIFRIQTEEQILDATWLWRHPALLVTSTDKALRVTDLRCPYMAGTSLFFDGHARLLTENHIRSNLMAAVVGEEIQIFDNRKLFGPLESYTTMRVMNEPIESLKWHPRNPNELLYSSSSSRCVGRVDTTNVQELLSRDRPTFSKNDLLPLHDVWESLRFKPEYLIKRLEKYQPMEHFHDFLTYDEQFELSRHDENSIAPFVLNPPRKIKRRHKPKHRFKLPIGPAFAKTKKLMKVDRSRLANDLEEFDINDPEVEDARAAVAEAFDYFQSKPDEERKTKPTEVVKDFESMREFMEKDPPAVPRAEEHPLIKNTAASRKPPYLGYWSKFEQEMFGSSDLNELTLKFASMQHPVDVRDLLAKSTIDKHIVKALAKELDKYLPREDFQLTTEVLCELASYAMRVKANKSKLRFKEPIAIGNDYVLGYVFDTRILAFDYGTIGYSGIVTYNAHPTKPLAFTPSFVKEEVLRYDTEYSAVLRQYTLKACYMSMPPEMWKLSKKRLMDGINPVLKKKFSKPRAKVLKCIPYVEKKGEPWPWWLIWAGGSAFYYEGRVRCPQFAPLKARYKELMRIQKEKRDAARAKLDEAAKPAQPRPAQPAEPPVVIPPPPLQGILIKRVYPTDTTNLPTPPSNNYPLQGILIKRKSINNGPPTITVHSPEQFPRKARMGDAAKNSEEEKPVEEAPVKPRKPRKPRPMFNAVPMRVYKKQHLLVKNPKRRIKRHYFNRHDFAMKGFPGLLQLSDRQLKMKRDRTVPCDVKCMYAMKFYSSPWRTRMLIPYSMACKDVREKCIKFHHNFDMQQFYNLQLLALMHGRFSVFVSVVEEMHFRFGPPPELEEGQEPDANYRNLELVEALMNITRLYIKLECKYKLGPKYAKKRKEVMSALDDFLEERCGGDTVEHILWPIMMILRCSLTGEHPQIYVDELMETDLLSFAQKLTFLVTMCDKYVMDMHLKEMFEEAQGIERLMFVGLGRHADCLNVLSRHLMETQDVQLVAHLAIAARIFEDRKHYFRTLAEIIRKKKINHKYKSSKKDGGSDSEEDLKSRKIARKKRLRYTYNPKSFKRRRFVRILGGTLRHRYCLMRHMQKVGRLPPLHHMHEIYHKKLLNNDTPLSSLMSVVRMAMARYLLVLRGNDHHFYRYHILSIIGDTNFSPPKITTARFELKCGFCGTVRSKVTRKRKRLNADQLKTQRIIKERADRRRAQFQAACDDRVAAGELPSYVPIEDINGSMMSTDLEMKAPPPQSCMQCRRPMPKCSICYLSERTTYIDKPASGPMSRLFTVCKKCNHGGHADHIAKWFRRRRFCPVADCDCLCGRRYNSEHGWRWNNQIKPMVSTRLYRIETKKKRKGTTYVIGPSRKQ